jgi:hypothetical protein
VSKVLGFFEHQGWIRLHRGSSEIVDRKALEEFLLHNETRPQL